jgi:hypothetical protein
VTGYSAGDWCILALAEALHRVVQKNSWQSAYVSLAKGATTRMSDSLDIQELVDLTYQKYASVHDGQIATYIPELGKVDPNDFAICVSTVDGQGVHDSVCVQAFRISNGTRETGPGQGSHPRRR